MTDRYSFALDMIDEVSSFLLQKRRRGFSIKEKGVNDYVTDDDRAAERIIRDRLAQAFPSDEILGEEYGISGTSSSLWVVDPIDGTVDYMNGFPFYTVSIAYMEGGKTVFGLVGVPEQNELFSAKKAEGAFLNGRPMRTADPRPLKQCLLATGDFSRRAESFRRGQANLMSRCYDDVGRFKMFGASCVDYSYLACGRIDVHVRFLNKKWDYLPGMYLAVKAGAVFDRALTRESRLLILCSSQEVLEEAVLRLAPVILRDS